MKRIWIILGVLAIVSGLAAVTVINIEEDEFGRRYPVIDTSYWQYQPLPTSRQRNASATQAELATMSDSDRDLFFRVNDAIDKAASSVPSSGIHPYDDVQVSVSNGRVTLKGSVPSLFYKNRTESIARQVNGVHSVQNELVSMQ